MSVRFTQETPSLNVRRHEHRNLRACVSVLRLRMRSKISKDLSSNWTRHRATNPAITIRVRAGPPILIGLWLELADAFGSNPNGRKVVEVRILSGRPICDWL